MGKMDFSFLKDLSFWKDMVSGMTRQVADVGKWGTFISKIGLPGFIIIFTMYYMIPIVDRLVEAHLEFLKESTKTQVETRQDIQEAKEIITDNQRKLAETVVTNQQRIMEYQRHHEDRTERISESLVETLKAMEQRLKHEHPNNETTTPQP